MKRLRAAFWKPPVQPAQPSRPGCAPPPRRTASAKSFAMLALEHPGARDRAAALRVVITLPAVDAGFGGTAPAAVPPAWQLIAVAAQTSEFPIFAVVPTGTACRTPAVAGAPACAGGAVGGDTETLESDDVVLCAQRGISVAARVLGRSPPSRCRRSRSARRAARRPAPQPRIDVCGRRGLALPGSGSRWRVVWLSRLIARSRR